MSPLSAIRASVLARPIETVSQTTLTICEASVGSQSRQAYMFLIVGIAIGVIGSSLLADLIAQYKGCECPQSIINQQQERQHAAIPAPPTEKVEGSQRGGVSAGGSPAAGITSVEV
ncbi:hypothetical protein IAU60_004057 [Kwoniella sp. DSM 27419]